MLDVIVIGGGPAGSAAAVRLARRGMKVALHEKTHFPRPKLCGGFISGEALPELKALGVLDLLNEKGAIPIHRVVLNSSKSICASMDLPQPALSVSRYVLDSLLLDQAREAGVDIHEGEDGFAHRFQAKWTVIATGRARHTTGRGACCVEPPVFTSPRHRACPYYGIQAFFENVAGISDQVELDLVPGGYVGLDRQEMGKINVCALINPSWMQRHGPDLDNVLRALANENPALSSHLRSARRQSAWQAVGPVTMGIRQLVGKNTFYVGDAACVVDPFVGEGMAMAMVGARLLADALAENPAASAQTYSDAWHRAFDQPLWLQNCLRRTIQSPLLQEAVVLGTRTFPPLFHWLTEKTRPPLAAA